MIDTFGGAKPRFLNRGKKHRSVSTLSIPRASDRGVEWVDFHRLIFIVIADDLPWLLPRKLGMHFSTLNLPKPMHF
jgi:hypothetical protein